MSEINLAAARRLLDHARLRFATLRDFDRPDHGLPLTKEQFCRLLREIRTSSFEVAGEMPGRLIFVACRDSEGNKSVAHYVVQIAYAVLTHLTDHSEIAAACFYFALTSRLAPSLELIAVVKDEVWVDSFIMIGRDQATLLGHPDGWNQDTVICDPGAGEADTVKSLRLASSLTMSRSRLWSSITQTETRLLPTQRHIGSYTQDDHHQLAVTTATINNIITKISQDRSVMEILSSAEALACHAYFKAKIAERDPAALDQVLRESSAIRDSDIRLWAARKLVQMPLHSLLPASNVLGFAANHVMEIKTALRQLTDDICPGKQWVVISGGDHRAEMRVDHMDQAKAILALFACSRRINARSMLLEEQNATMILLSPIPPLDEINRLVRMNESARAFRSRQGMSAGK